MPAADIITKVQDQYHKAKESGDLVHFPSRVVRHREPDINVEFWITLCPALKNKPQHSKQSNVKPFFVAAEKKAFDPFAPPYNENLLITELKDEGSGEEYVVLLNKFSVVPNHFLLVSKEYEVQSSPLLPSDLVQTYKLLKVAQKVGRKIIAFYNCGDLSGASQHHKHIQFIPAEQDPPIETLANSINLEMPTKPFTIASLPYANHVFRFPENIPEETLEQLLANTFISLLDLVISTIRHVPDYPAGRPSYNVIMTTRHMHLIPRRCEEFVLPGTEYLISVNALGYAGMFLVKTDEELEKVKAYGIGKILRAVGLESVHEVQVAGTTDEAVRE